MVPLIVMFGVIGIGMVLVDLLHHRKNRWGINLDAVSCPRSNIPFPQIRKRKLCNKGGGTCSASGAKVDKWGRELGSHAKKSPKSSQESPTRKEPHEEAHRLHCSSLSLA